MARKKNNRKTKTSKKPLNAREALIYTKGLIIEWEDKDPNNESSAVENLSVHHSNSVLNIKSWDIWAKYRAWLNTDVVLLWKIDITVVFENDPNVPVDTHEHRRIVHRGILQDISSACELIINELNRYGTGPITTKFTCTCLGNRSATDKDFGDFE